jgi:hypothetical protein
MGHYIIHHGTVIYRIVRTQLKCEANKKEYLHSMQINDKGNNIECIFIYCELASARLVIHSILRFRACVCGRSRAAGLPDRSVCLLLVTVTVTMQADTSLAKLLEPKLCILVCLTNVQQS